MTEAFDPGPLAEVATELGDRTWTLVFVRDLRHPPALVWAALTEPEQLDEWAPFVADRDLGSPGDATLTMVDGDVREDLPPPSSGPSRPACWSTPGGRTGCAGSWSPPRAAPG